MTHAAHDVLPGYDPEQLLVDGCGECERRSRLPGLGVAELDGERFAAAWRRAAALHRDDESGPYSAAERPLLSALWAVQIQLERRGIRIGEPPGADPPLIPLGDAALLRLIHVDGSTTAAAAYAAAYPLDRYPPADPPEWHRDEPDQDA